MRATPATSPAELADRDLLRSARDALDLLRRYAWEIDSDAELRDVANALDKAIEARAAFGEVVYTPSEIARHWQVSAKSVRGWIDDGELEAFNAGRGTVARWRIPQSAAMAFLKKRRV